MAIEISCKQYGYLCTYFAAVFQITLTARLRWEIKSGEVSYPNSIKRKQLADDFRVSARIKRGVTFRRCIKIQEL